MLAMIKINLLSEGKKPTAVRRSKSTSSSLADRDLAPMLLLVGLIVGVLAVALLWFLATRERADVQERIVEAEAEVARLEPILREVEEFREKQASLERKIEVITDLKNNQTGPVRVMDEVSLALPELLWLDTMQVEGNQIRLSGRAFNINAISNFIENLDRVPEFAEPRAGRIEKRGQIHTFNITVGFNLAPVEAGDGTDTASVAAGG